MEQLRPRLYQCIINECILIKSFFACVGLPSSSDPALHSRCGRPTSKNCSSMAGIQLQLRLYFFLTPSYHMQAPLVVHSTPPSPRNICPVCKGGLLDLLELTF